MRCLLSSSSKKASRRSQIRFATLDGWPIQIGVPIINISASRMRRSNFGQSSPRPSFELTPGMMLRSTTRTISPLQSKEESARPSCLSRTSVDDCFPLRPPLSVQFNAINLRFCGAMVSLGDPTVRTKSSSIVDNGGHNAGLKRDARAGSRKIAKHRFLGNNWGLKGLFHAATMKVQLCAEKRKQHLSLTHAWLLSAIILNWREWSLLNSVRSPVGLSRIGPKIKKA